MTTAVAQLQKQKARGQTRELMVASTAAMHATQAEKIGRIMKLKAMHTVDINNASSEVRNELDENQ